MFSLFQGRTNIFKIHARSMSVEKDIRYELLARLCPNSTGKLIFIWTACSDIMNSLYNIKTKQKGGGLGQKSK